MKFAVLALAMMAGKAAGTMPPLPLCSDSNTDCTGSTSGGSNSQQKIYTPGSDIITHSNIDQLVNAYQTWVPGAVDDSNAAEEMAAAENIYEKGAGVSSPYVEYNVKNGGFFKSNGAGDAATASDMPSSTSSSEYKDFTCTATLTGAGGATVIGKLKENVGLASTTVKIYLKTESSQYSQHYGTTTGVHDCGVIDTSKVPGVSSEPLLWEQDSCPDATDGDVVSCTDDTKTFTFKAGGTNKYAGRSLKGFSTSGAAKMDGSKAKNKPLCDGTNFGGSGCNSIVAETDFVKAKEFHGMPDYADAHVQLAIEAMKQQIAGDSEGTFSDCQTSGSALYAAGATSNLCTVANDDGDSTNTFTQGSIICKDKDTRVPVIPTGNNLAEQKTDCEDNLNGVVTDFFARPWLFNVEVAQKMQVFTNVWMYTVHEFEDAIQDCKGGDPNNNDKGVHAWDEGVAFYTGSRQVKDTDTGKLLYYLANKRCPNFNTCRNGADGPSLVNDAILVQFNEGLYQTTAASFSSCNKGAAALEKIKSLMTIPVIQGTLRYAYKVGVEAKEPDDGPSKPGKAAGEGMAFMMSAVHRVHACNPDDAKLIYDAMFGLKTQSNTPLTLMDGIFYAQVKKAFENNYQCMGITCADVGGLASSISSHNGYWPGAEACVDVAPAPAPAPAGAGGGGGGETTNDVPDWALGVIGGASFLVLIFFGMMCGYKSSKDATVKMYNDLKKEGAMGKV